MSAAAPAMTYAAPSPVTYTAPSPVTYATPSTMSLDRTKDRLPQIDLAKLKKYDELNPAKLQKAMLITVPMSLIETENGEESMRSWCCHSNHFARECPQLICWGCGGRGRFQACCNLLPFRPFARDFSDSSMYSVELDSHDRFVLGLYES